MQTRAAFTGLALQPQSSEVESDKPEQRPIKWASFAFMISYYEVCLQRGRLPKLPVICALYFWGMREDLTGASRTEYSRGFFIKFKPSCWFLHSEKRGTRNTSGEQRNFLKKSRKVPSFWERHTFWKSAECFETTSNIIMLCINLYALSLREMCQL